MASLNQTEQEYYNSNDYGSYQFVSLQDIINQFMFVYVGEDKIISKASRTDVAFHAQRALAELSFDTFKSYKAMEVKVPSTLRVELPHDYVNYVKLSAIDDDGAKRVLYPTGYASIPKQPWVDENKQKIFYDGESVGSGDILINGSFYGGSNSWDLNVVKNSSGAWDEDEDLVDATRFDDTSVFNGEPEQGFFAMKNSIEAYITGAGEGIRQNNVPIISGEEYEIKFTLSKNTNRDFSCRVHVVIIDENGDYTETTQVDTQGDYNEVLLAGINSSISNAGTRADYTPRSSVILYSNQDDSNFRVDNFSITRVTNKTETNIQVVDRGKGLYTSSRVIERTADDATTNYYEPSKYGLEPQYTQRNGSFYIDSNSGLINFSSNLNERFIILDYISDSLGSEEEMQVHKLAEEAIYKWISYGIISSRVNTPETIVRRLKKERFAETRKAKLRLSNIKLEEITQILRGKSKWIKH
jgi:hypothetical protein